MALTVADSPLVVHMIDELPRDGAEMLLLDLMRTRHPQLRYEIACLIRGGPLQPEFEHIGVPVTVFGRRAKLDPVLVWRLARWLKRKRASIVHTHLFTADTYGRLAARLAGVPVVYSTAHNIVNPWKGALHKGIDRTFARLSTGVIGCSDEVAQALRDRDGIAPDRVLTISNGIELAKFSEISGAGVRTEFGLPEDRKLIGVVGRLHPQKGHEDLLQALAGMEAARSGRLACLVIGTGELDQTLRAKVTALGLDGCVIFTGMRTDVPRLIAAVDAIVMPSRWEGLPIALLESMASAKPVLCTRVGGIPDVVRDGENGLLVEAGDVQALRARLTWLLEHPSEGTALGIQARDTVLGRFDVRRTAAAYNRLHCQALGLPVDDWLPASGPLA